MDSKLGDALKFGPRAQIVLWIALVAIGVCGRLWQPAYSVTPFAAIGLAAGSLFGISLAAAAVPIVALAISNLALPGYGSTAMALVVCGSLACPVLFGSLIRRQGWIALIGGMSCIVTPLFHHNKFCLLGVNLHVLPYLLWPYCLLRSGTAVLPMDACG